MAQAASGTFPWASVAQLGISMYQGYTDRQVGRVNYGMQRAQYETSKSLFTQNQRIGAAQHQLAMAQANAQNAVTAANNTMENASAGLSNFMTSENNRRRLEASGAAINAATMSLARQRETQTDNKLEDRLSEVEAAGAYAANAALAGVSGSSVDTIETAMRLKAARAARYRDRANAYADYDGLEQLAGMKAQQYTEQDFTVTLPNLNLSHSSAGVYVPGVFAVAPPQNNVRGNAGTDLAGFMLGNSTATRQLADYGSTFFRSSPAYSAPKIEYQDSIGGVNANFG